MENCHVNQGARQCCDDKGNPSLRGEKALGRYP